MHSLLDICVVSIIIACITQLQAYDDRGSVWYRKNCKNRLYSLPRDIQFDVNQVQLTKALGKLEIIADSNIISDARRELSRLGHPDASSALSASPNGRAVTCRVFEAQIPGGMKCYVKEFLPIGLMFGKRERSATRRLTVRWNEMVGLQQQGGPPSDASPLSAQDKRLLRLWTGSASPPFPLLLGYVRADESVKGEKFRGEWGRRFPRLPCALPYSLWLVYHYDAAAFKSFKRFPPLPQVIEGLDYFNAQQREKKRWCFLRTLMRKTLESVDFLHSTGYCHNSLSSECLWMSTTDQLRRAELHVQITDLSIAQTFADLGPAGSREGVVEDLYRLGMVFLELVLASFSEDDVGAQQVRRRLKQLPEPTPLEKLLGNSLQPEPTRVKPVLQQLSYSEVQEVFEKMCGSDYEQFLTFCRSITAWKVAVRMLDAEEGVGWRMIFTLLTRGRLYDKEGGKPLAVSAYRLIRDFPALFHDTY